MPYKYLLAIDRRSRSFHDLTLADRLFPMMLAVSQGSSGCLPNGIGSFADPFEPFIRHFSPPSWTFRTAGKDECSRCGIIMVPADYRLCPELHKQIGKPCSHEEKSGICRGKPFEKPVAGHAIKQAISGPAFVTCRIKRPGDMTAPGPRSVSMTKITLPNGRHPNIATSMGLLALGWNWQKHRRECPRLMACRLSAGRVGADGRSEQRFGVGIGVRNKGPVLMQRAKILSPCGW